ncbi:hypothetical protein [Streptomyces sp. NPDC048106]|uniref:hypothetical protein n=1 Tax=Streptomyces sp. NPDC048106 TaxID=3155750 RepID=UPI00345413A6
MNLQQEQSEDVVALPPGRAAVAFDGMDRPVLTAIPHGEHDESTKGASAAPPLFGSRSRLCGASCRGEPCTLRTMNDAHHRSLEPLHLIWVEAAACAQAMGMAAPAPAAGVRAALTALAARDLECTLVYAAERAVFARDALMRDEVDPADFAERLHAVLSAELLGTEPPPAADRRRHTYANYRFRDVLEVIQRARKAAPDGPHSYPEHEAEWASRGLVLTGTSGADHRLQVRALPGYGPEKVHARIGDVERSGLRDAVAAVTGGMTEEQVRRAFALACGRARGCARWSRRRRHEWRGCAPGRRGPTDEQTRRRSPRRPATPCGGRTGRRGRSRTGRVRRERRDTAGGRPRGSGRRPGQGRPGPLPRT